MPEPTMTTALFAHVQAALDEGFALDEVLAKEGLSQRAWADALIDVRRRVAAGAESRAEYEEAHVAAQDRFAREVSPVERDVAAWLAFVDALAAAPAPFAWLTRLGLRMSDVARLRRAWVKRAQADETLDAKIAELRKTRLPPLPRLTIGAASYVRLSTAPDAEAAAPVSRAAGVVDGVGIDELAQLDVEIARAPGATDAVLARRGLDRARHDALRGAFERSCERDASLRVDYLRLRALAELRMRVGAASPIPAVAAIDARANARELGERLRAGGLSMRGTAAADASPPRARALPFEETHAASPLASASASRNALDAAGAGDAVDVDSTLEIDRGRAALGPLVPFARVDADEARRLTLEQFASLTAELTCRRAPPGELLTKYGVGPDHWPNEDARWRRALALDVAERARFEALCRQYVEFLSKA